MIILHQFPPAYGSHFSVSPFAAKVEAYMRLAGIDYETAPGDPFKAPLGKIPYIGIDGELVGDSGLIVERLKQIYGDPLDARLTRTEQGLGHLVRRTLEEHLYWALLHSRFGDERCWPQQRGAVAAALPPPLRPILPTIVRRGIRKALKAHGLGRHDQAQIYRAGIQDLESCLEVLGAKPYLFGDEPTSYDCSLFPMANAVMTTPTSNALTTGAKGMPALVAYVDRMAERLGAR